MLAKFGCWDVLVTDSALMRLDMTLVNFCSLLKGVPVQKFQLRSLAVAVTAWMSCVESVLISSS